MVLIICNERPSNGCRSRKIVTEFGMSRWWVVCDAFLRQHPARRLMALVAGSISDGRVLALIEGFLKQDIMKDMERWQPTVGTPQGGVITP
jgi:RNA-directed DNA polymerase